MTVSGQLYTLALQTSIKISIWPWREGQTKWF